MPSSLPFDVTRRPCSCSVTMTHQRLFQWFCRVRLQRLHSLCAGILRPLTECQRLLNNGTSWKASVVTVEFVRPHCFGGLFPESFWWFTESTDEKSKQQKKSQTQRKAYICHDGLSHWVKAVFFAHTLTAISNTFICRRKNHSCFLLQSCCVRIGVCSTWLQCISDHLWKCRSNQNLSLMPSGFIYISPFMRLKESFASRKMNL